MDHVQDALEGTPVVDPKLLALLDEHTMLLQQLAPVLRKVGPLHAQRGSVNHDRSVKRRMLRVQLAKCEADIVAHCHFLFPRIPLHAATQVHASASQG